MRRTVMAHMRLDDLPNLPRRFALALVLIAAGGCASGGGGGTALSPVSEAAAGGAGGAAGGYELTAEEKALDCKKLTGRMQVRILQIRDYDGKPTSSLSRQMQTGATSIFGGSSHGIDPASTNSRDRAKLEAYNRQLAAKGCPTFDLDAELKPKDFRETPRPAAKP